MSRSLRRAKPKTRICNGYPVVSSSLTAPIAFLLLFLSCIAPVSQARQRLQPKLPASPQQTLVQALTSACSQNGQNFSRFLLSGSRRAFIALTEARQKAFLMRFSLTSMPGHPRALLDAQGRMVVQCQTPAETVTFGLSPAHVNGNVAFIPVAVSGGETVNFGLVRQPDGWRLFSLDLLVINVPALVQQWQNAEIHANEQAASADLITIAQAIKQYHSSFGKWPDTLAQLGPAPPNQVSPEHAQLLSGGIVSGTADGYRFRYRVVTGSHGQIQGFELGAVPVKYGQTGRRSFFLDEQGKLHAGDHQGGPATASDPVIPLPPQTGS